MNTEPYRVEVEWLPGYELVLSLNAFLDKPRHRTLDAGTAWARRVKGQLESGVAAERLAGDGVPAVLLLLLVRAYGSNGDIEGFLHWVSDLSAGDLYERVSSQVMKGADDNLHDLGAQRDRAVRLLTLWHEHYFRHLDPAILTGLKADAEQKRSLIGTMPAEDLVEMATGGLRLLPANPPEVVLLVPQYHHRPWNVFTFYCRTWLYQYPADVLPTVPGEPPARLMRLARALSDESRLRVLRFLAGGPRSFTEVVRFSGLSKSTVHHHMVALRAAGLVRVHDSGEGQTNYSLRLEAVSELGENLQDYLRE